MDLTVFIELLVHGPWFSVHGSQLWKHKHIIELIVFRSNCWFTVPGSWFTVMETHIENGADWVKWIKYNRLKPEMLFSVHGDMVHSFGNSQRWLCLRSTCSCFVHKEWVLVVSWIMDQMGQWIIVLWGFIYACMCLPEHLEAVSALLMWYYPESIFSGHQENSLKRRSISDGFDRDLILYQNFDSVKRVAC